MRAIAVTTAALALVVAGCASSGGGAVAGGPGGTAVGTPPRKIEVGFSAKGRTVSAHLNDVIEVRLESTYWRFHPVMGGVLSRGKFVSRPEHGPPGVGAGTMVATFRALKSGTARVSAGRASCGEALRCVGGQDSYAFTVVVR
jgi:hypothetical protein